MPKISIMIADDHPLFRKGIRMAIQGSGEYEIKGEASNTSELMSLLRQQEYQAIMLDLSMPEGKIEKQGNILTDIDRDKDQLDFPGRKRLLKRYSGLLALQEIKRYWPGIKVLVITQHDDREAVAWALELGADGYLLKEEVGDDLLQVLGSIMAGHRTFSKKVELLISRKYGQVGDGSSSDLSKREYEVLACVASGLKEDEIADRLTISKRTVAFHKRNIKDKLNLETTGEMIAFYLTRKA